MAPGCARRVNTFALRPRRDQRPRNKWSTNYSGGVGRIKGYYEWDDDGLRPGQARVGGLHQNLFDSEGHLQGSARFVPTEDSDAEPLVVTETVYVTVEERRRSREEEELQEVINELVYQLLRRGAAKAWPVAERWWHEVARPAVGAQKTKLRDRVSRRRTRRDLAAGDSLEGGRAIDVAESVDERVKMSAAEAQARNLAAYAARAFSDEQLRLVNDAEIVGARDVDAVTQSLAALPPSQVRGLMAAMAKDPTLLTDEALADLASLLGRLSQSGLIRGQVNGG